MNSAPRRAHVARVVPRKEATKSDVHQLLRHGLVRAAPSPRSWVGRTSELEQLALLAETHRLVVVSGLAGIGKTSLVREHLAREDLPALWVDDPPLCAEIPADTSTLVLDDVDVADADLIDELLARSPALSIFVTTTNTRWCKAPTFELRGLSTTLNATGSSNAAELFALHSPTSVESRDFDLVERVVRLVDGHPRAVIDLAARLRSMRLEELLDRKDRLVDLLTDTTVGPIRTRIEELDEPTACALAASIAFRGTFALADLESVLPDRLSALPEATDALSARGFLVRSGRKGSELSVPPLVAAAENGSLVRPPTLARRIHARVSEVAAHYFETCLAIPPRVGASLRRFSPELLRVVWTAETTSAPPPPAVLLLACEDFSKLTDDERDYWTRQLDELSTSELGDSAPTRRCLLRAGLGIAFSYVRTKPELGERFVEGVPSHAVFESGRADLSVLAAFARIQLRWSALSLTDARAQLNDVETRARAAGNLTLAALASIYGANTHVRAGERAAAFSCGSRALLDAERAEDAALIAQIKISLAELFLRLGDPAEARRICLEIKASRELEHDPYAHAYTLVQLGNSYVFAGGDDDANAARYLREALFATRHEFVGTTRAAAGLAMAFVHFRAGDWQAALESAESAARECRLLGATNDEVECLLATCVAARKLGRPSYVKARLDAIQTLLASENAVKHRGTAVLLDLLEADAPNVREVDAFIRENGHVPSSLSEHFDLELHVAALMASFLVTGAPLTPSIDVHVFGTGERIVVGVQVVVDLCAFPTLRRLFWALATEHWDDPARSLSLEDLASKVWIGQKISYAAIKNRIHVSLSKLRKLGLANAFEVSDERVRISGLVRLTHEPDLRR